MKLLSAVHGVGEGHARDGRAGALEVGDLAVERLEVRGILRLGEQAEEARALARALLGLVDRLELGPVGLAPALVLGAQDHQDVELAPILHRIIAILWSSLAHENIVITFVIKLFKIMT